MSAARKCCFLKPDGTACRAAATASGYCFFHDGDKAAEAGKKGGKRSRKRHPVILPVDAEDVPLTTVGDVTTALAVLYNAVRRGQLDSRTGNTLCLIAGQLLKAMQESELAADIEELEREIEELKRANSGNNQQPAQEDTRGSAGDPPAGDASNSTLAS